MSTPSLKPDMAQGARSTSVPPQPPILPTLFGDGYDIYQVNRKSFLASYAFVTLLAALAAYSGHFVIQHVDVIKQSVASVVTDISPYVMKPSKQQVGGGGGGGDRDKIEASKGALPKFALQQITPAMRVIRNDNPKIAVTPTVVVPPEIHIAQNMPVLGDPFSHNVTGPESNGVGSGAGMGSGSGGGVGSGAGPGVGPGYGGGIGGGIYHVGGGVSSPETIFAPEPEYSEEGRKLKAQGTVVLSCLVGPDGRAHEIHIARSLGFGLDEKAIEAVRQWKFDPARKDGQAVTVAVNIEVNFHLY